MKNNQKITPYKANYLWPLYGVIKSQYIGFVSWYIIKGEP